MAAETDDLPDQIKAEVRQFAAVNVRWLEQMLAASASLPAGDCALRAEAIFAAVAGAQLIARSRADVAVYDQLIAGYVSAGLIPS
jgi:TetR/AcrR family transcriptional repressor of nem operon